MKFIFTLLFLSFVLSPVFSQFKLDSIIEKDIVTGELEYSYTFAYDNDKLINFSEEIDEVDIDIFYNENGTYDYWVNTFEDETVNFNFIYDASNNLDSLNFIYTDDSGYSFNFLHDIDAEGTKILGWRAFESYGNETISTYDAEILYNANNQFDSIKFYDNYTGSPTLNYYYTYTYNDDGKTKNVKYLDGFHDLLTKDSFLYDGGSLTNIYNLSYYGNPYLESLQMYEIDESISSDDIVSPADFLGFFEPFQGTDYLNVLYPMKYGKIEEHVTDYGDWTTESTWYYSLFTGIINEPIVATPITIYPNPTVDFIRFKTDIEIEKYSIYTMTGQLVKSEEITSEEIFVTNLSIGEYTIIGHDDNGKNYFSTFVKM